MKNFVIAMVLLCACCACGQEKSPSLNRTLSYMRHTLDRYQLLNSPQTLLTNDEPCRMFVEDFLYWDDVAHDVEYQFHLRNIDPDSVKATTSSNGKVFMVRFHTTDNQELIWMSATDWEEHKDSVPDKFSLMSLTSYDFKFRDSEQVENFAKALRHAVLLCGGKPSAF